MQISANYSNGQSEEITTGFTISADLSSSGIETVTVSYKGKTTTLNVTVENISDPVVETASPLPTVTPTESVPISTSTPATTEPTSKPILTPIPTPTKVGGGIIGSLTWTVTLDGILTISGGTEMPDFDPKDTAEENKTDDTYDNIGHGTSVCEVVAASYGFDGCIGTAHKAHIIPLKFIDRASDGSVIGGTTSTLAKAIISTVDDFGCDIINMSCGTIDSNTLKTAVDSTVGNDGSDKYNYPAAYDNVIGVGSINGSKEHSSFSNTNDSVFVMAPGEKVNVLFGIDSFVSTSGTSFSAPYVCGIAADMKEIKSDITYSDIMSVISETSEDLGGEGYDTEYGYGLIRADKIVDYMLKEYKYFISPIDLCKADNFNEIRIKVTDGSSPALIFAEYNEDVSSQITISSQIIYDNIYMARLKYNEDGTLKYFLWNSLNDMIPIE